MFILEDKETTPGTLLNMINVLYLFVIYRLYLNYKAKLTVEWQIINHRHNFARMLFQHRQKQRTIKDKLSFQSVFIG